MPHLRLEQTLVLVRRLVHRCEGVTHRIGRPHRRRGGVRNKWGRVPFGRDPLRAASAGWARSLVHPRASAPAGVLAQPIPQQPPIRRANWPFEKRIERQPGTRIFAQINHPPLPSLRVAPFDHHIALLEADTAAIEPRQFLRTVAFVATLSPPPSLTEKALVGATGFEP